MNETLLVAQVIQKVLMATAMLFTLSPLALAAQKPSTNSSKNSAHKNLVKRKGFQFIAAGGWILLKTNPEHAALAGPAAAGKLNTSFTVLTNTLDPAMKFTLSEVAEFNRRQIPKMVKQAKIIGEKTVKMGNSKTQGVRWTYTGIQEKTKFRWTQMITLKDNVMYTVTLAVPEGTLPQVVKSGQNMMNSFRFTKK